MEQTVLGSIFQDRPEDSKTVREPKGVAMLEEAPTSGKLALPESFDAG